MTKVMEVATKTAVVEEISPAAAAKLGFIKHDRAMGGEVIALEALTPDDRKTVVALYHKVDAALEQFGKSALKVGEALHEAREWLKPRGLWMAWLRRLPGMSPKTADRFINRHLTSQKLLPAPVLAVAQAAGLNLAGETEKEPYGRYTKVVRRVGGPPKPTGDAGVDMEKARAWVGQVVTAHQKGVSAARAKAKQVDPVEAVAERLVEGIQRYAKEEASQIQMLAKVLKKATQLLGYGRYLEKKGRDMVTLHLVA